MTDSTSASVPHSSTGRDYREMVRHMLDGFALHEIILDESGAPIDYRFLEVNPAFEKLTGFRCGQIVGRTVLEVMPQTETSWIERFGKVALTGAELHCEDYSREIARHFEVKAWCPAPGQFACTFVDISERKQAERALALSEERFRHLAESMADWIWEVDAGCVYTYASPRVEDVLGYTVDEVLGKTPFDFMPTDEATRVRAEFTALADHRQPLRDLENWNQTKDGRRICLLTNGVPILGPAGELLGYRGVDRDITGLKEQLGKNMQMGRLTALGEMASGVAHEINNPVTGIINCAQLLQGRLPQDEALQGIVTRILREGFRISRIVNSLLSVAHPGRKGHEPINLYLLIDDVLALFETQLGKDGIELVRQISPNIPLFFGERQQIEQMLLNLLGNARYALNERFPAAHPDKRLTIGARMVDEDRVRIEILDHGTGIPAENLERIFHPFFTTKPTGVGTGLGLGLCHEIVRHHGGEIRVESEFGCFTRFCVELPVKTFEHSRVQSGEAS